VVLLSVAPRSLVLATAMLFAAPPLLSHAPGQINLVNTHWDSVQIELRIGTSEQCQLNPTAGVRTLPRGRVWAVVGEAVVCWRRETTPGARDGQWTPWQSRQPVPQSTEIVEL